MRIIPLRKRNELFSRHSFSDESSDVDGVGPSPATIDRSDAGVEPEDDTVFLAPIRDFSPGGEQEDDTEFASPFAEGMHEPTPDRVFMSPVRRQDVASEDRPSKIEPTAEIAPLPRFSETPPPQARPERGKNASKIEALIPIKRLSMDLSPIDPTPAKSPADRSLSRRLPADSLSADPLPANALPDVPLRNTEKQPAARANDLTRADDLLFKEILSNLPASLEGASTAKWKRAGHRGRADSDPVVPPTPARRMPAILPAVASSGRAILAALAWIWATYSHQSSVIENMLSHLVRWASVRVWRATLALGSAVVRFGRATLAALRTGIIYSGKTAAFVGTAALSVGRHASVSAGRAARGMAVFGGAAMLSAGRQSLVLADQAARGAAAFSGVALSVGGRALARAGQAARAAAAFSGIALSVGGRALVLAGRAARHGFVLLKSALASLARAIGTGTVTVGIFLARYTRQGAVASSWMICEGAAVLRRGSIAAARHFKVLVSSLRSRAAAKISAAKTVEEVALPLIEAAAPAPCIPPSSPVGRASLPLEHESASRSIQALSRPAASTGPAAKPLVRQQVTASLRQPRSTPFLAFLRPKMALAGLATASIAVLLVAVGAALAPAPSQALLTVPIPERPLVSAAFAAPAESVPSSRGEDEAGKDRNGKLLVVFGPLPPLIPKNDPLADIIAHIKSRPSFDITSLLATAETIDGLEQFVLAARTVGLDKLLQSERGYTIFAPSDAAFAGLGPNTLGGLLETSGHERLLTLLSHHVLRERLTRDDLAADTRQYTSLAGEAVTIDATDGIRIDGAAKVGVGLEAEKGILHVIDAVLAAPEP